MEGHGSLPPNDGQHQVPIGGGFSWNIVAPEDQDAAFIATLSDFQQNRQEPLLSEWSILGQEISPRLFFETVFANGGFLAIDEHGTWPHIAQSILGLDIYHFLTGQSSEAALVEATRNLYWTGLYGFEQAFLSPTTYANTDLPVVNDFMPSFSSEIESGVAENGFQSSSPKSGSAAQQSGTMPESGSFFDEASGNIDSNIDYTGVEFDSSPKEEVKRIPHLTKLVRILKQHSVKISPSTLMEMFTTRPEHTRTMTWKHQLDTNPNFKIVTNDFTKTPIPRVSARLMGKQREGLLMKKLERAFNNSSSPTDRGAALSALQTRSWSKVFILSLYPTLLDAFLQCTELLLQRLNLTSATSHLFNVSGNDAESDLSHLLRVSIILKNLSQSPQNLNLLASHDQVIRVVSIFINLRRMLKAPQAGLSSIFSYSPADVYHICSHWKDLDEGILMELRCRVELESNENEASVSSPNDALEVIHRLKSNISHSILASIQFNALEALTNMLHLIKLAPTTSSPQALTMSGDALMSEKGAYIQECLPSLIAVIIDPAPKNTLLFLAVESVSKLALNSNSHPMWQAQDYNMKAQLIETLIRYAVMDDELSDWSIFGAVHLALNALDMSVAQILASNEQFLDDLMLLVTSYATPPKTGGSKEISQQFAYRRHTFAVRSATILHRLVEFVPLNAYLLGYEKAIADIYLHAPSEIANPFYRVFIEMQT